jgi:hypothetical protein
MFSSDEGDVSDGSDVGKKATRFCPSITFITFITFITRLP